MKAAPLRPTPGVLNLAEVQAKMDQEYLAVGFDRYRCPRRYGQHGSRVNEFRTARVYNVDYQMESPSAKLDAMGC